MDPEEALRQILWAHDEKDYEILVGAALGLRNWLRRGGFMPIMNDIVSRAVLLTLCDTARDSALLGIASKRKKGKVMNPNDVLTVMSRAVLKGRWLTALDLADALEEQLEETGIYPDDLAPIHVDAFIEAVRAATTQGGGGA